MGGGVKRVQPSHCGRMGEIFVLCVRYDEMVVLQINSLKDIVVVDSRTSCRNNEGILTGLDTLNIEYELTFMHTDLNKSSAGSTRGQEYAPVSMIRERRANLDRTLIHS